MLLLNWMGTILVKATRDGWWKFGQISNLIDNWRHFSKNSQNNPPHILPLFLEQWETEPHKFVLLLITLLAWALVYLSLSLSFFPESHLYWVHSWKTANRPYFTVLTSKKLSSPHAWASGLELLYRDEVMLLFEVIWHGLT